MTVNLMYDEDPPTMSTASAGTAPQEEIRLSTISSARPRARLTREMPAAGHSASGATAPVLCGAAGGSLLADIVRSRLREGIWPPGHVFTWMELATEFNVTRVTRSIAMAMNILRKEGLIEARPYFGTRVTLENDTWNPDNEVPGTTHAQHIEISVRRHIAEGIYPAGALIPSLDDLAREFGVSAASVRHGLQPLRDQGFIEARRCVGHFVTPLVDSVDRDELLTLSVRKFRRNDPVEAFGVRKNLSAWSRDPRCAVSFGLLKNRYLQQRWALEDALTTPNGVKRRTSAAMPQEDPTLITEPDLDGAYASLTPESQNLYRQLAILPARTVDPRLAAGVFGHSPGEAVRLLDTLSDLGLVEEAGPTLEDDAVYRYSARQRQHARALAAGQDSEAARGQVLRRLCDWVLASASAAQQVMTPEQAALPRTYTAGQPFAVCAFADKAQALAWLKTYGPNLLDTLRSAAGAGWHDTVWQLVDSFRPLFHHTHDYPLWIEAHEIGLAAAKHAGNPEAVRQMLTSGAIGLQNAGQHERARAWYEEARAAAVAAGDVHDEGQAELGLAACATAAGHVESAGSHLGRAVELWQACGYRRGVELVSIARGEAAAASGDFTGAEVWFTGAYVALRDLADDMNAVRALALRGHARALGGDSAAGAADLRNALFYFESVSAGDWCARTHDMLGEVLHAAGDTRGSRIHYGLAAAGYDHFAPEKAERLRSTLESAIGPGAL